MTSLLVRRAAVLLAAAVAAATTACTSDSAQPEPARSSVPSATSSAPAWPTALEQAGYRPPAPYTPAHDRHWNEQVRERVADLSADGPGKPWPAAAEDVTVVASGDFDRARYAVAVYSTERGDDLVIWTRLFLLGPPEAEAAELTEVYRNSLSDEVPTDPFAVFLTYRRPSPETAGLALITAPGAREVDLTHEAAETEWSVPMQDESGVWVADLVERDLVEPGYLVDGVPGTALFAGNWPRGRLER